MGRKLLVSVLLSLVIIVPRADLLGATMSWTINIGLGEVQFREIKPGEVSVHVEGDATTNYLGYPDLPFRVVNVLLPQGEVVSACDLVVRRTVELDPSIDLAPFEGDYRDDGIRMGISARREDIVGEDSEFPRWRVRHVGTSTYRGYLIAAFAIYPFRYNLETGRLTLDGDVELIVETRTEPAVRTETVERERYIEGFRERSRVLAASRVVNPEMVDTYSFQEIEVDHGDRGFVPSYLPSMEGSEVLYLIITNESMAPAFDMFAEWKTQKGIPAVVRTVEWIRQNYRSGSDLGESVRIFIQEAYAKWGVEYVLLGGDTDVIPERQAYTTFYYGEFIPTDMYYSCLDGNWNADSDSLWGEAYGGASNPGDGTDMYSEVYIGRFPASTYEEAEILIDKSIAYITPSDTSSKGEFLILAEVIYPSNYNPGDDIVLDGAELGEMIYTGHLESNTDVVTTRMYETYGSYPGSVELTKAAAIDSLNEGTNHVVHIGHGYKYNMSVGDASILNTDAYNLINGNALFTMYLMNCTNVAFDTDCLAEMFLLNPDGGAFSVVGASRSAFPSASQPYMEYYYNLLFDYDVVQLGKLYSDSRIPFTPAAEIESTDRWTHFILNLLGDPEACLFQGEASVFDVTMPTSAVFGLNDITVEVSSGGMPHDSAYVCLYKDNDDYAYYYTNGSGLVLFEDFLCRSDGYIYVTVTGRNHCRFIDSIQVTQESAAYLRVWDKSLTDNIVGNDDGVLDAGETVDLQVKLKNTGETDAEKLYAILRSSDSWISIPDSTATYPNIVADGSAFALDGFLLEIDPGTVDEHVFEFTIDIHDSTGGSWSEQFAMEAHAPELELFINSMSDTLPYGNDNGVIEDGETFLLKVGVKNFGSGAAYGLEGKIRSSDGDISITDSVSTYEDLSILGFDQGDGFVLAESNIGEVNYYTFELKDAYDRVFSKRMELRPPGAPTNVVLDATLGPTEMHVTWHRPDSNETYGYVVYHSLESGINYVMDSEDLVIHTMYRDYDLLPSTRYYFSVTTVDSCGNEGPRSAEVTNTTTPPQLTGWPNKVGKETASSVKVADVDGDRHPDIVVGAEYVYAWNANGIELHDGDDQPLTWGILSTEGDNYTATVALADLDGNPGKEIVAASWNTEEIYIFDHEGNVLPGWPREVERLVWASPVVGDIDDDGDYEVIVYDRRGTLYVWHHDGTEFMDGDGNPSTDGIFKTTSPNAWSCPTPACADIDEDGVNEIIFSTPGDSIYAVNSDGSDVPGWPVALIYSDANVTTSPAVGDVDDDGHLEVIVQDGYWQVYGLNHDGTMMGGFPFSIATSSSFAGSPALADLTGDGKLEIVLVAVDSYCHIRRYDGSALTNWPQMYASSGGCESSPTIADINDDGSLDIILASEEGRLNAWEIDGSPLPGFPIQVGSFLRGTPVVKDLDLDGDLEIVTSCWDQNVYVWDLDAAAGYGYSAWNGFHGNIHNTGNVDFEPVTAANGITCSFRLIRGAIELSWSVQHEDEYWTLYRKIADGEFEFMLSDLRADEGGVVQFVDPTVQEGMVYSYRLEAGSGSGLALETNGIEVPVSRPNLYQNHPNPFNPATTISFTVPGGEGARECVLLAVYDVTGKRVKTLVNGVVSGGRYDITWDGRNDNGCRVSSGVYFSQFRMKGYKATKKMILLR